VIFTRTATVCRNEWSSQFEFDPPIFIIVNSIKTQNRPRSWWSSLEESS